MDIQNITQYIESPLNMQEEDFDQIKSLIEKYPYFHTANMLFIKAAHNINYENFNELVVKVSASVPNREILYSLINLKEEVIEEEIKEEKEEETGARKEIRERIQQRRKKRQLEKGEILNESGFKWHELIMNEFFEPTIIDLVKDSDRIGYMPLEDVVVEKPIKVERSETKGKENIDFDKSQLKEVDPELEKRKAEREKRRLERLKKREEESETDKNKSRTSQESSDTELQKRKEEREKRRLERMKKREEMKQGDIIQDRKTELKEEKQSEEIDLELQKKKEEREKRKHERLNIENENDDSKDAVISVEKDEEKNFTSEDQKENIVIDSEEKKDKKKKDIIIEDIKPLKGNKDEGVGEGNVIENIYDTIMSSKRPPKEVDETSSFIEIKEDITGLETIPEEIKEDVPEIKEDKEINDGNAENLFADLVDNKEEAPQDDIELMEEEFKDEAVTINEDKDDIKVETEHEFELIDSKKSEVNLDEGEIIEIKDDIEDLNLSETKIELKEEEEKEKVEVDKESFDKEQSDNTEDEILIEDDPIEIISENKEVQQINNFDEERIDEIDDQESIKEELPVDSNNTKEESQLESNKTEENTDDKSKMAADDVFARIEAFKKKREGSDNKKDDLIDKFVNDSPAISKPDDTSIDKTDISEESAKEKKPVETELMAQIFINQSKYSQAIEIYEKLILKNPEKKDYFAAKIEETKKLM